MSVSVAFLGLGVMGGGMASRLLDAGMRLTVWNRRMDRTAPVAARGATVASSPREAASRADLVITMVADDEASRAVWLGATGAVTGLRPGAVAIESSTVSPVWVGELGKAVAARGAALLDAPVTGSRLQAARGELRFLVGGAAEALDRARAALEAMGREIVHVGPAGAGARMKLINNFLCGVQAAALAEAVALIERAGLDPAVAVPVLTNGAPGSPLVSTVAARMMGRDYPVNFALSLMRKDLAYAAADADAFGLDLRTATTARELFDDAVAAGRGGEDFAAVVEPLRGRS